MPDIFTKDAKIKVIEYGSNQQGLEFFSEWRDKIINFFRRNIKK